MNYLNQIVLVVFLFVLGSSCDKKNDYTAPIKNMNDKKVGEFFEEVSAMDIELSEENVLYIKYEFNKENNTISVIDVEEREPKFFVLESSQNIKDKRAAAKYTVQCDNGSNSWFKGCSGKISCVTLIANCLDEGGCATICSGEMAYAPQVSTFYVGNVLATTP